ncbi:MAG: hypothetical protein ISR69_01165 [Gammaproteobacteria bacterium]|nr:hypothetical protein [Gammaproteobacteria bacterium]
MKSPQQLSQQLAKQWQSADKREQRLLTTNAWPIQIPIGKPTAKEIKNSPQQVAQHIKHWREVKIGQILRQTVNYQATSESVEIPIFWQINTVEEWVDACHQKVVTQEYSLLNSVIAKVDKQFHGVIIRQKALCLKSPAEQLIQACQLALQLEPACAQGKPLRALAFANIDTKFIENHRSLIIKLLNQRFHLNLNTNQLESFLGATNNNEHWLLIKPLDDNLLAFNQIRLRASELHTIELPATHILIVENEQCQYQLPNLPNTIAILGAGLNLSWLNNPSFTSKQLAYWGDIDSWGLKMLSMAKLAQPHITALMMNQKIFEQYQHKAVVEPQHAGKDIPESLTETESKLYKKLINLDKGRFEQEFIEPSVVSNHLKQWLGLS